MTELALVAAGDAGLGQQQLHRSTAQLMEQSHSGKHDAHSCLKDVCMYIIDCLRQLAGHLAPSGPRAPQRLPSRSVTELSLLQLLVLGLSNNFEHASTSIYTLVYGCTLLGQTLSTPCTTHRM